MSKVDTKSDNDVRDVLEPLAGLAEKYGVAVVCLMHNNKGQSTKALYKVMGSVGFTGTARRVWGIYSDPSDPTRCLLTFIKSNVGNNRKGLAYRIEDAGDDIGKVVYESGYVEQTADDLQNPNNETSKLEYAKAWVKEQLQHGAVDSVELKQRAERAGIASRTLWRAKDEWGKENIRAVKVGMDGWQWSWVGATDAAEAAESPDPRDDQPF